MTRRISLRNVALARTSTTPTAPYRRTDERAASCALCGHEAEFCCPRCGRPLCVAHSVAAGRRCGECEASFASRRRLSDNLGFGAGALTFVAACLWIGFGPLTGSLIAYAGYALVALALATAVGVVLWSVASGAQRRRFLAEGEGSFLLKGELSIASAVEASGDGRRRVGVGAGGGDRGIPRLPIYQRTYGH